LFLVDYVINSFFFKMLFHNKTFNLNSRYLLTFFVIELFWLILFSIESFSSLFLSQNSQIVVLNSADIFKYDNNPCWFCSHSIILQRLFHNKIFHWHLRKILIFFCSW
jgi:hypothetical protein